MLIIAALVFDVGLYRDDPSRLLRMPIREVVFWYDLCVGWRKEKDNMGKETATPQTSNVRSFTGGRSPLPFRA